ncbi:phytoene desaturase family protein [Desulfosediminicola flagellatus]|uniref:phytoene desaturase family protein n=1 Tax=Desulfosediminicola flagellatus TaxID=2569541 RepID=UPI0010ABF3C8|nr:NAD(P)/FAD-dependent oxidoreductase [Desulfosediminicola flagellatus]
MKAPCIVIGGGLSGLAAAIRLARFTPDVLLLEMHTRLGGLNSYYFRNKTLFETGLHAITNYAEPGNKRAPLNRLLRQLKLNRKSLIFHQQKQSEIVFSNRESLTFSNDFETLRQEIRLKFPRAENSFNELCTFLEQFDPFKPTPFRSAKSYLLSTLKDQLLVDMLLCPLMYYGSSVENDMDLSQFAIMFQAIYREGFFRPSGTIKDFLSIFSDHLKHLGGTIRLGAKVERILYKNNSVYGVRLSSGEIIECDHILSTIGHQETRSILELQDTEPDSGRLGFIESIFQLPATAKDSLPKDKTVIFFNAADQFNYKQPSHFADYMSGVICMPYNFDGLPLHNSLEIRSTHLASYGKWHEIRNDTENYLKEKSISRRRSLEVVEKIVGNFRNNIIYEDTFTPLTIERYTAKKHGAIYGSPTKIKDGYIGFDNLFLAGTDQGFLGIVGSMLSGVSIVNQHILPKI